MTSMDSLISYAWAVSPLVVASTLVPTLTRGRKMRHLQRRLLLKHFAYSDHNVKEGRWWTLLLYMFLHYDPEHLCANMISLIFVSFPVHGVFGTLALYSIYFGGGMLAVLDRRSRMHELSRFLAGRVEVDESLGPVASSLNQLTQHCSDLMAPRLVTKQYLVGASAGVCSVSGVLLCLLLEVASTGADLSASLLFRILVCLQPLLVDVQDYGSSFQAALRRLEPQVASLRQRLHRAIRRSFRPFL
eukprot:GGOE01020159.1.p1 GENE.GGOE01020159.1~~GGOE01020159.1.p1  ORF type:complete len:245 (-),score=44.70 GGOE01020159.1:129-863(-)